MNLISQKRAEDFEKYKWLCDPIFATWIVDILGAYGKSILDIGCGNGYMFEFYKNMFERVGAIEPSRTFERQLNDKVKNCNIDFKIASAENIPFQSKSYDISIAKSSFHHFVDPCVGVNEMVRVSSNVIAIIEVVAPSQKTISFLEELLTEKEKERKRESVYTANDIKNILLENDSIKKVYCHYYDQYIELDTWIEFGDLANENKQRIRKHFENMEAVTKEDMQFHIRNGHPCMLRRMCMMVGFIE